MIALIREAGASARSQPVASTVTVLVVIGMILTIMLTTGRTVGSEQQILGSIDSAGTRSIVIRAEQDAGLKANALERIARIQGIEWAGAFSPAMDATNSAVPDGTRVPVRFVYGGDLARLGLPERTAIQDLAWASPLALQQFGLPDSVGGITTVSGTSFGMSGVLTVTEELRQLEPLALIPRENWDDSVGLIIVIAQSPELVVPVSEAVFSVLAPEDPSMITVQTSAALAELRGLIQDQLGAFSRGLVLILLGVMGALVAILLYGLVMMRRKDFGRRRALGATRGLIVTLLLVQTSLLATMGISIGILVATLTLVASGDPLPGPPFTAALAVLTLMTTVIAALVPALVASFREPIRELRVP